VNSAPEIVAFEEETDTLRYFPGVPMLITEVFEVTDADDDTLAVAEIGFVSEFYAIGSDQLQFNSTTKIKGEFDQATGLLTLTGAAPVKDYNAAVRAVKYQYTGTNDSDDNIKRIYARVSDGKNFGELKQRVVKISSGVSDLDIPTAFTPNSDGANDTWRILSPGDISGSEFADAEVRVYDKRGTVVFGASGLQSTWDGTYQGKQLPVDTYYYIIDLKQQQKRYKGIVAILR
jgi:gliding motility-associated-like protein